MPRELLAATGELAGFTGKIVRDVWSLRVFHFFGEALRQSGILIIYSTIFIWSLAFLIGLGACGIEAAYFNQSISAPTYSGVYAAWCNLREAVPYVFGYMMAAKVGTGIVAELGAMRISEEIDALEVMGVDSMLFLCATRLLAAWMVLPFMYVGAIGIAYLASYLAIVEQLGYVSSGGYPARLLAVPEPGGLLIQRHQGHDDGHGDRARGLLLRLQRQRRTGGRGQGDGQVDGAQPGADPPDRDVRHAALLGRQRARPGRGVRMSEDRSAEQPAEPAGSPRPRASRSSPSSARAKRRRSSAITPGRSVPPRQPDAIEFIDVHKSFGRNHVLRGLSMGLPENQISMIIGPSGTGKSVCIKHIVGLLYPDEGDVLVHGVSVPSLSDAELFEMRRKFGVLFQDGALFGSLNLYDNVAFPLRQHTEKGEEEIAEIVNRRMREVGLGGEGAKMPSELSGGMRKRAGFARALVLDPEIVLFDEPDSGLDPVRTALLCELIKEVHAEHGGCYVVITHDIMSARRVAEHHLGPVEGPDRRVRAGGAAVRLGEPVRPPVPLR